MRVLKFFRLLTTAVWYIAYINCNESSVNSQPGAEMLQYVVFFLHIPGSDALFSVVAAAQKIKNVIDD